MFRLVPKPSASVKAPTLRNHRFNKGLFRAMGKPHADRAPASST
jgi:hypothetical protein